MPSQLQSWGREHYIPLKTQELIAYLVDRQREKGSDSEALERLFRQIVSLIHQQYRKHHEQLVLLYHDFDPDADETPSQIDVPIFGSKEERDLACRKLFSEVADSLEYANYRRLKPREIQQALNVASYWGVRLKIRFSSFRRLEVYGRGDIIAKRTKRDWYRLFRAIEVDVPIYQRLVVIFRTKELQNLPELLDPDCVHVRMFKNIPKLDVDMMLPGSQIKMTWMDTGKIGVPTLWGLMMLASKIAKSIGLLAFLGAVKFFGSFVFVIAIVIASLFYGVKSVLSYTTAKRRYQLNVARNLYYQNLDNNLGALLRIEEESEQQESCEAILAYFVLNNSTSESLSSEQVDREAEGILNAVTGIDIDFDVEDALRDLAGMGIVRLTSEGWVGSGVEEAIERTAIRRGYHE
jgi:Protein of unknown function (DUF3754)